MTRTGLVVLSVLLTAGAARAHVTPNVEVVARGEFVRTALAGASRYFEKSLTLDAEQRGAVRQATGWELAGDDARVYVGRDGEGRLVGTTIFLWMPSQHGPVGLGAAFAPDGKLLRAGVTDVGSEPLDWVRPLLAADGLAVLAGLPLGERPAAARIAPGVQGRMSRYYAEVIADGIARAQALEAALRPGIPATTKP